MSGSTVNRDEYSSNQKGEKYQLAKKPKESGILKGEGSFAQETSTSLEFTPKQGERYPVKTNKESSELWKVSKRQKFWFNFLEH